MALRGDPEAREPLLEELARAPTIAVIEAISAVWDEDAIVHLGRCARRHPPLAGLVLEVLHGIESPRAATVAGLLEADGLGPASGGE